MTNFCTRVARSASAMLLLAMTALHFASGAAAGDDPWPDIHKAVFDGRAIEESAAAVKIFAPNEAQDAAIVPITLTIAANHVPEVRSLTFIIDRNPVPVAAKFTFGEAYRKVAGDLDRTIATRVRIDAFSRVRAVIEMLDGSLKMTSKFIIGAGGCSAPAAKDQDEALAQLGRTQLKLMKDQSRPRWREAQVMIRHPNFTGMQREKNSGNFTPARYVDLIDITEGSELLMRVEGGISISEDPNIRFSWETDKQEQVAFSAKDTDGAHFTATAAADGS